MPLATRRDIGQFLIGSMPGTSDAGGAAIAGARVRSRRRDPVQPQHRGARTGGRARRPRARRSGRTMPAWVSVDQEGGRVARLKEPFTKWPPMATLGRAGKAVEALAERFAKALAEELLAVGITLDYAPVLDIHTNPKNPGDRRSRAGRARRGRREARPRDHPRAAGRRPRRVRQALSRTRRHQHRLALRAAARRACAGSAARDRVRAVPGRDGRAGRVHHDRPRAGAVAGRGAAGHAVARRSCRSCCATS